MTHTKPLRHPRLPLNCSTDAGRHVVLFNTEVWIKPRNLKLPLCGFHQANLAAHTVTLTLDQATGAAQDCHHGYFVCPLPIQVSVCPQVNVGYSCSGRLSPRVFPLTEWLSAQSDVSARFLHLPPAGSTNTVKCVKYDVNTSGLQVQNKTIGDDHRGGATFVIPRIHGFLCGVTWHAFGVTRV